MAHGRNAVAITVLRQRAIEQEEARMPRQVSKVPDETLIERYARRPELAIETSHNLVEVVDLLNRVRPAPNKRLPRQVRRAPNLRQKLEQQLPLLLTPQAIYRLLSFYQLEHILQLMTIAFDGVVNDFEASLTLYENLLCATELLARPTRKQEPSPITIQAITVCLSLHRARRWENQRVALLQSLGRLMAEGTLWPIDPVGYAVGASLPPHPTLTTLYARAAVNQRARAILEAMTNLWESLDFLLITEEEVPTLLSVGPDVVIWDAPRQIRSAYAAFTAEFQARLIPPAARDLMQLAHDNRQVIVESCRQLWDDIIHRPVALIQEGGLDWFEVHGPVGVVAGTRRYFVREGYHPPEVGLGTELPGLKGPRYKIGALRPDSLDRAIAIELQMEKRNGVGGLVLVDHLADVLAYHAIVCRQPNDKSAHAAGITHRPPQKDKEYPVRAYWRLVAPGARPNPAQVAFGLEKSGWEKAPPGKTFVDATKRPYLGKTGLANTGRSAEEIVPILRIDPEQAIRSLL